MKTSFIYKSWLTSALLVLPIVLLSAATVHAADWLSVESAPFSGTFADPLLAKPPQIDNGKTLPGDANTPICDNSHYDGTKPLALSDAIDLALCHNPQVQSAWVAIKIQAAQVGEARAAYLPTINVGVSRSHQNSKYTDGPFQITSEQTANSHYVTLAWRLLDFGGRGANRLSANALLEAALASHDAVLQATLANVIEAYFDAQTAHANRLAKEEGEVLARQTLSTAQKREARGVGMHSDTLQATTALAKAELESARASGQYDKALTTLVVAVGLPLHVLKTHALVLAQDYSDQDDTLQEDLASWLALAQEHHPALHAAQAHLESTKEKMSVIRSEGLPTLDFAQNWYVNGRPNQGLPTTQTKESTIGVSINFPLFEGFGRTYKVRGAQAQIEIKQAELKDTQNRVLGEVIKAYADAAAALRNLSSSKRLWSAAQEALVDVRRKYDRGIVDILEMLSVQAALADAQQQRVSALADWRSARLQLIAKAGMLGRKDIQGKG